MKLKQRFLEQQLFFILQLSASLYINNLIIFKVAWLYNLCAHIRVAFIFQLSKSLAPNPLFQLAEN